MSLAVENILGIIDRDGEEELALDLSSFLCGVNDEIQTFLTDKAIEFARKKMSITSPICGAVVRMESISEPDRVPEDVSHSMDKAF